MRFCKKAFTLIELLVVVSIIALLLSIMTPSLQKARESTRTVVCKNNLKQLLLAQVMYANDFRIFAHYTAAGSPPIRSVYRYLQTENLWRPNDVPAGEAINRKPYLCPSLPAAIKSTPAGQVANPLDGNMHPYSWNFFLGGYFYRATAPRYPLRGPTNIKNPQSVFGWADSCDIVVNTQEYAQSGTFHGPGSYGWSVTNGRGYEKIVLRHGAQKQKYEANYWELKRIPVVSNGVRKANVAFLDGHVDTIDADAAAHKAYYANPE